MNRSLLFILFFFLLALPCSHAARITPAAAPRQTPTLWQRMYRKNHHSLVPDYQTWWSTKSTITYALSPSNIINMISRDDIKGAIRRSFETWAAVIPFEFVETEHYEKANVKVAFNRGYRFDGPGGKFAYGVGSLTNGVIHLDADETWCIGSYPVQSAETRTCTMDWGVELESAVTHEIGHVLGLVHSSNVLSIMYPSQNEGELKVNLTADDILAVQALYRSDSQQGLYRSDSKQKWFFKWPVLVLLVVLLCCCSVYILWCVCKFLKKKI